MFRYNKLKKNVFKNRFFIKNLNPWWAKVAREFNFKVHSKMSRACSEIYIRLFSAYYVNDSSFNSNLSNNGQNCHMYSV